MSEPRKLVYRAYPDVRHLFEDGDQLQYRNGEFFTGIGPSESAAARGGVHSHSAKAVWFRDYRGVPSILCAVQTREFEGGTMHPLSDEVKRYPGHIDWFKANAGNRWSYDREAVAYYMVRHSGHHYGNAVILRSLWHHINLLLKPDLADGEENPEPVCSGLCSAADDLAGRVKPVPWRANDAVEPADLTNSLFYDYQCTLVMTRAEADDLNNAESYFLPFSADPTPSDGEPWE